MKLKTSKTASKNHTPVPTSASEESDVASTFQAYPSIKGKRNKASPTGTGSQSHPAVLDAITIRTPQIDKIIAVLMGADVSAADQETIADRLQRQLSTKTLSRGSAKGEPFKRVFIQRLPTGAVVKYAVEPTRPDHVVQFMQITLNPNLMEAEDVSAFGNMVATIFGPQWARRMTALKYRRVDACVDVAGVLVNDLIVLFDGSRTQATFFVQCDRNGRIQTIYVGSVQSAQHGCVYDQVDSDAYKRLVGEKPSSPLERKKAREDAELAIVAQPTQAKTRFEVRNVLSPMLSITEIAKMESAMHRFTVYEIRSTKGVKMTSQFRMYLDCVRLRGVSGARAYLTTGAKKRVQDKVQANEDQLTKMSAIWWEPSVFALDVRAALERHGLWVVLNPKASPRGADVAG